MVARPPQLIGESPLFHALLDRVSDLASLEYPVLIVGARGTGKELMASRMHFLSPRWEQAFMSVNCAAYKEDALEELLFGRADYTGRASLDGRLDAADGGTFLLDHIEAASPRLQEKLARTLEHGEYEPVGSTETETVDLRFICSTAADLPTMVKNGLFSAELLDRMSFEVLRLLPLKGRGEDIAALSEHFGRRAAAHIGADRFPGFTPEALAFLTAQPWPGNVRELKNVVDRSVANAFLADESLVQPVHKVRMDVFGGGHVPEAAEDAAPNESQAAPPETLATTDFTARVTAFERGLIDQALTLHDHHQGKAAEYLGLTYHQFRGILRKHGLKK